MSLPYMEPGSASRLLALAVLGWTAVVGGLRAEDQTAPAQPDENPGGEPPRIRYWLRDPASPQEAKPEVPAGKEAEQAAERAQENEERTAEDRRKALRAEFKRMLESAELAFKAKDYAQTVSLCRNILSADPRNTKAVELLTKAHDMQAEADTRVTRAALDRKSREAILEGEEHTVRPPVRAPEARPRWPRREDDPTIPRRRKMAELLEEPVTVDFMKADMDWVFNTLFVLTGVNIIADPAAIEDKKLTLHVEKIPLREVLNFIVRNNDKIQFSVTEDAVWITATAAEDLKKLMYPKIYPLHHGLVSTQEAEGQGAGSGAGSSRGPTSGGTNPRRNPSSGTSGGRNQGGRQGGQGGQNGQSNMEPSYIETVLKWLKEAKDAQAFPDGSDYLVDRQSNQLIVFTTPAGHKKMEEFLDAFDQPAIQVLIKTRFLEIRQDHDKSIGINIENISTRVGAASNGDPNSPSGGSGGTAVSIRDPFRTITFAGNTPAALAGGAVFSVAGLRTDPQFKATLNLLLNDKRTRLLSEPQVLAINNKEAQIDVSTNFSYITRLNPRQNTVIVSGTGTQPPSQTQYDPEFEQEEVGFKLKVTPSVGRDLKTINLHLTPIIDALSPEGGQTISSFSTVTLPSDNSPLIFPRPTIDQQTVETDVVLDDNGYVIIGGLIRNTDEVTEKKVPGLHRIPYLGNLFKTRGATRSTKNLVIIVEAQIVTQRGRTYRTDPNPDDGDIREGSVNRAPGQVSEVVRPDAVNQALGLTPGAEAAAPPRPGMPGAAAPRVEERAGLGRSLSAPVPAKEPRAGAELKLEDTAARRWQTAPEEEAAPAEPAAAPRRTAAKDEGAKASVVEP